MYFLNSKQQELIKIINKFGSIKKSQLEILSGRNDIDRILEPVFKQKKAPIKLEDDVFLSVFKNADKKMLAALSILSYIYESGPEDVVWYGTEDFPFILAFIRNEKVFDISVVEQGEELIYAAAINRSVAERIVIILEDESQIKKIKINDINKQKKYCIIKDREITFLETGDE